MGLSPPPFVPKLMHPAYGMVGEGPPYVSFLQQVDDIDVQCLR